MENFKKYTHMSDEVVAAGPEGVTIHKTAQRRSIPALRFPKEEHTMIELKLLVDEVDYDSLAETLPLVQDKLRDSGGCWAGCCPAARRWPRLWRGRRCGP